MQWWRIRLLLTWSLASWRTDAKARVPGRTQWSRSLPELPVLPGGLPRAAGMCGPKRDSTPCAWLEGPGAAGGHRQGLGSSSHLAATGPGNQHMHRYYMLRH